VEKIGKTENEIDASQLLECRKIVKNILDFGVTEKQKIQIIYLMSLELESRDALNIFVESVKKVKNLNENIKFSLINEDADYNKDVIQEQKIKLLDI
jgi:S-adenosylmethionine synthetase